VVDRTALEMRHTCKRIGGSNPPLSANYSTRKRSIPSPAGKENVSSPVERHDSDLRHKAGWLDALADAFAVFSVKYEKLFFGESYPDLFTCPRRVIFRSFDGQEIASDFQRHQRVIANKFRGINCTL
jgi:hypothetical protein